MRRSSTTVSGPATVRLRRYGAKLLQNSSDSTRPSAPAIIRMIPTVLMLNPEALTSTAKVKIAPTTSRKMLTPRLTLLASSIVRRPLVIRPLLLWLLVRAWVRGCCYESPAHQAALASPVRLDLSRSERQGCNALRLRWRCPEPDAMATL